MKVLVGCTGSVATIKVHEIVQALKQRNVEVEVVATRNSLHFLNKEEMEGVKIWKDDDEWEMWNQRGDPVLHINLRNWADLLLISPLDANTLAKMSHVGIELPDITFPSLDSFT